MARGAAQTRGKTAKKPQTGTRKQAAARRPPSVESTMFFPRLRRQAKWVFVFLAFVFAASFVFFGVGSGSAGLGDLLRGNFNIFGSGGGSTTSTAVKDALKKTQAHPKDPEAWRALATAYSGDGKLDKANKANEHLLKLRPNDTSTLQSVAGFYETKAQNKANEASVLQAQLPVSIGTILGVSQTSQLGQALTNDPTTTQLQQKINAAITAENSALQKDTATYKRLAKLQPDDVNTQFHYAQLADLTGDPASAIKAYERVVKLAPKDPAAQQARQRIAALKAATVPSAYR
ncbi:MAG TPA: tetratricopeptide repeat protein [Gaiellaceae bacterium]